MREEGKANSAKSLPPEVYVGKQNATGFGFGQIIHSHRSPRPRTQAPCTASREEPAAGAKLSAALPPPSLEMPQSQQPRATGRPSLPVWGLLPWVHSLPPRASRAPKNQAHVGASGARPGQVEWGCVSRACNWVAVSGANPCR